MTPANGYNPLRWDCGKRGCFNLKRRPKIELFADCFPGRCNFGDVDGIVEVKGNALLLEWKSELRALPRGQRILYQRLTRTGACSVVIVVGDAETMAVDAMSIIHGGVQSPYEPADLDLVKRELTAWSDWASRNPALILPREDAA